MCILVLGEFLFHLFYLRGRGHVFEFPVAELGNLFIYILLPQIEVGGFPLIQA